MKRCIGVIHSGYSPETYDTLCKTRPDYMLPFGGRYRIVDFILSGLSNNISNVVLYAGNNMRSTLDHVGNGKNWELNRKRGGLMILPPSYERGMDLPNEMITYYSSLRFYEDRRESVIYVANPMVLAKIDIEDAFTTFIEEDLDVMFVYKKQYDPEGNFIQHGKSIVHDKLIVNDKGELVNVGINLGTEDEFNLYLGKMFIKKDLFIQIVKQSVERGGATTLLEAVLHEKDRLKIGTYEFEHHVEAIRDTKSYYEANMNLLDREVYNSMFYEGGMILTKSKDEPSTLYKSGSKTINSLVANGCVIEGQLESSVVFRDVHVGKNAIIKNSLLLQGARVEEDAIVVNSIVDKFGVIQQGAVIVGSPIKPYVVEKLQVIKRS